MNDERLRTDTAERPAVRAPLPPAAAPVPPPPSPPPTDRPLPRSPRPRTPAPPWVAWLVVAISLVLAAVIGTWLVVQPGGDDNATATDPRTSQAAEDDAPAEEEPAAEPAEPKAEPTDEAGREPPADGPPGERIDITALVTPTAPPAAPANNDVTGELVTFTAANMMDANPVTCWRMAGDGTGSTLTFTFSAPVWLELVGLINGYAKTSVDGSGRSFDWYHGNRRILRAEWVVGDQVFTQDFTDSTEPQTLEIEPVETTTVELRLVEVSPPGAGPTGRDYTAISDVVFGGNFA
jgi:hypothetical protein